MLGIFIWQTHGELFSYVIPSSTSEDAWKSFFDFEKRYEGTEVLFMWVERDGAMLRDKYVLERTDVPLKPVRKSPTLTFLKVFDDGSPTR